MLIGCIITAATAWADDNDATAPQPPQTEAQTPILDAGLARQAFSLGENWVARGRVPRQTLTVAVRHLAAVHVTLRLDGLTLGQATVAVPTSQHRSTVDLMDYTRRGVAQALDVCLERVRKLNEQMPQRRLPTDMADLAPLLQLDLQCAYPPVAMRFDSPIDLPGLFRVGEHGLMLSHEGRNAWLFAGNAIAANLNLQAQIDRLLGQLDLPPITSQKLGKKDGPALHRFEMIHLVRLRQADDPAQLVRGRVPLETAPLNGKQADRYAAMWAKHLIARQQPGGWFAGTYLPSANQYEPALSDPASCGLACYALARYARSLNPEDPRRQAAETAAIKGITALTKQLLGREGASITERPNLLQLSDCSMALIALLETPGTAKLKKQRDRLAGAILAMQKPNGVFRNADAAKARDATIPTASLAAYAMARMYDQARQPQHLQCARRAIDVLLQNTPASKLPSAYPWLPMAEFELSRVGKGSPALVTFREAAIDILKKQVEAEQISPTGLGKDAVGGFTQQSNFIGEPTWLSARPLAMIAASLRVPYFVSEKERTLWLVNAARGMRFLAQLTTEPAGCYYVRNPGRALGGVHTAMWDNRQPLAATAMALLAGAELQLSLQSMK